MSAREDAGPNGSELGLGGLLVWLAMFGAALAGLEQLAGWPAQPALPDHLPSWNAIQIWLNRPLVDIGPVLPIAFDLGWIVWGLTAASIALQVLVDLLDAATRGAAWVGSLRLATSWLVVPPIRRAVDASLSGLLLARVLVQPAAALEASAVPMANIVTLAPADRPRDSFDRMKIPLGGVHGEIAAYATDGLQQPADPSNATLDVIYTVQPGDTLWALGGRFYGDPQNGAEIIFEANQGRRQADGRVFNRRGLIFVGWTLRIPDPTRSIQRAANGTWWYTVQPGDTLDGISARLLGDPERRLEIFQLNRGARAPDGHVLVDPNLIWPELQLQVPLNGAIAPPAEAQPPAEPPPASLPPTIAPFVSVEPDHREQPPAQPAPVAALASELPLVAIASPTPAPRETEAPVEAPPAIQGSPTAQPVERMPTGSSNPVSPAEARARRGWSRRGGTGRRPTGGLQAQAGPRP
jgi:nucleoid-associated protein YgaU